MKRVLPLVIAVCLLLSMASCASGNRVDFTITNGAYNCTPQEVIDLLNGSNDRDIYKIPAFVESDTPIEISGKPSHLKIAFATDNDGHITSITLSAAKNAMTGEATLSLSFYLGVLLGQTMDENDMEIAHGIMGNLMDSEGAEQYSANGTVVDGFAKGGTLRFKVQPCEKRESVPADNAEQTDDFIVFSDDMPSLCKKIEDLIIAQSSYPNCFVQEPNFAPDDDGSGDCYTYAVDDGVTLVFYTPAGSDKVHTVQVIGVPTAYTDKSEQTFMIYASEVISALEESADLYVQIMTKLNTTNVDYTAMEMTMATGSTADYLYLITGDNANILTISPLQ